MLMLLWSMSYADGRSSTENAFFFNADLDFNLRTDNICLFRVDTGCKQSEYQQKCDLSICIQRTHPRSQL